MAILSHFELTDREFQSCIRNHSLDPALFNHSAYVRYAFLNFKQYSFEKAMNETCDTFKTYKDLYGNGKGFDEASMKQALKMVSKGVEESRVGTFISFLVRYPKIIVSFKEIINEKTTDSSTIHYN